jgi:hypothetical protein
VGIGRSITDPQRRGGLLGRFAFSDQRQHLGSRSVSEKTMRTASSSGVKMTGLRLLTSTAEPTKP